MTKQELLDALRDATGQNRELDAEIALVAGWQESYDMDTGASIFRTPDDVETTLPTFTASLDAANDFRERMLPGWRVSAITQYARHWDVELINDDSGLVAIEWCATECLSRVAAVIAALIIQEMNRDQ